MDGFKLDQVHEYFSRLEDYSKIFNFSDIKFGFVQFEVQIMFLELPQHSLHLNVVCLLVSRHDEEVIYIASQPSFPNHVFEDMVHHTLECCRCIA